MWANIKQPATGAGCGLPMKRNCLTACSPRRLGHRNFLFPSRSACLLASRHVSMLTKCQSPWTEAPLRSGNIPETPPGRTSRRGGGRTLTRGTVQAASRTGSVAGPGNVRCHWALRAADTEAGAASLPPAAAPSDRDKWTKGGPSGTLRTSSHPQAERGPVGPYRKWVWASYRWGLAHGLAPPWWSLTAGRVRACAPTDASRSGGRILFLSGCSAAAKKSFRCTMQTTSRPVCLHDRWINPLNPRERRKGMT